MKFTMTATIPTVQYGNLQPSIEVEAETLEEAKAKVMPEIQSIWNSVCEDGKELVIRGELPQGVTTSVKQVLMKPAIGDVELLIDDNHVYTDSDGKVYQSGSMFAKQFEYDFDKAKILPIYASKYEESPQTIDDFWNAKAKLSTDFGTAIHQAMEVYGKFGKLADKLNNAKEEEKQVSIPTGIHPIILPIVESFFAEHLNEQALYEPFISSKELGRCGQIDRLVVIDKEKKICIIDDFKTNIDLNKQGSPKYLKAPYGKDSETPLMNSPMGTYTIQLNFYRSILEKNGWTVKGMRLHHLAEDGWSTIDLPKVEI